MAINGRKPARRSLPPTPSFSAKAAATCRTSRFTAPTAPNGDTNYNPLFPFKMRGSVDPYGNVIGRRRQRLQSDLCDRRADRDQCEFRHHRPQRRFVRQHAGEAGRRHGFEQPDGAWPRRTTPAWRRQTFLDLRDNPPGYADDVFLGYEQTAFQFRNGPEKFAARNSASNNIVSLGAETYYYTVGVSNNAASPARATGRPSPTRPRTGFFTIRPTAITSLSATIPPTQRNPLSPTTGQSADICVEVGYQFQINTCFIYYTTDGSNPEGAFGTGKGTTQVVQAFYVNRDSAQNNTDWWKGTIPAQPNGTQVRYKVAMFYGGSVYAGQSISRFPTPKRPAPSFTA